MISVPDMAIIGALALMLFGPEQLPKVARKVGHVMRDVQNTSQSFIREMERAADGYDVPASTSTESYGAAPHYDPLPAEHDPAPETPAPEPVPAAQGDRPPHARASANPEYRVD